MTMNKETGETSSLAERRAVSPLFTTLSGPGGADVMERAVVSALNALLASQHFPLLPPEVMLNMEMLRGARVLDVLCGDGEWVHDLAFLRARARAAARTSAGADHEGQRQGEGSEGMIVGVDPRPACIALARATTRAMGLRTLRFRVETLTRMTLADDSFDLVHLQGLALLLPAQDWPAVLAEATRVLRPGGTLVCTEFAWPKTTTLSGESLAALVRQVLETTGFTPLRLGHLGELVRQTGLQQVREQWVSLDLSAGTRTHWFLVERCLPLLSILQPYLSQSGLMEAARFEALVQELQVEAYVQTFQAEWPVLSVLAEKPQR